MFEREEDGRRPPYGPALDIGCGSGIWSVNLAKRGWDVTGIDIVPKALRRARERARKAGVDARFVQGDVTALRAAGAGTGFRLLLDFNCFHDLNDAQRAAVGREATAIAAEGATLPMMAWTPTRRNPMLPRGAGRADVEGAFAGWNVMDEQAVDVSGAPGSVQKAEPRWYRLRRG